MKGSGTELIVLRMADLLRQGRQLPWNARTDLHSRLELGPVLARRRGEKRFAYTERVLSLRRPTEWKIVLLHLIAKMDDHGSLYTGASHNYAPLRSKG